MRVGSSCIRMSHYSAVFAPSTANRATENPVGPPITFHLFHVLLSHILFGVSKRCFRRSLPVGGDLKC